ncbi:copper amine oxidase N-terminal domain-containing protein [Syntrophomonas erecta subsp. sporosyntropha]
MRKPIALMLTLALLLTMTAPVMAFTPSAILDEVKLMRANGKLSNDSITQAVVDLSFIESNGSVTATVYESVYENQTINTYPNLSKQSPASCTNKLTRFVFELTNRYRPQNTDLAIGVSPDRLTVQTYVYGQYKDQAMYAFLSGIPDCLNNEPYSRPTGRGSSSKSSDNSWIEPYSPENIGTDPITSFQVTTFAIANKSYTIATTDMDEEKTVTSGTKTMDVAPYIKGDRTYVPVRYLAYSLGVGEDNVTWDGKDRKVGITKDDVDISLFIGSHVMYVSQEPVEMDVAPEITNARTFLPARWVAEALGAEVDWDDVTKQAIIKMPIKEPGD